MFFKQRVQEIVKVTLHWSLDPFHPSKGDHALEADLCDTQASCSNDYYSSWIWSCLFFWETEMNRVSLFRENPLPCLDYFVLFNCGKIKHEDFPGSSTGKESACNTGDPGSTRGLGWSPGEGIGYPLQCSWVSLLTQIVKNPPEMRETWVRSLGWEDPLEEGMATHSSVLAWRISMEPGGLQPMGSQRVRHDWAPKHSTYRTVFIILTYVSV